MNTFTSNVVKIIRQIPSGRVMTYGQIAALAGSPRGARQVVRILHSMSQKYQLPWHRVINKQGQLALQDEPFAMQQRLNLEGEGVEVSPDGYVDLARFQHHPDFID